MRMSWDCPAAATACLSARFLGRCASFSFRQPNPTAADVTIMTPKPAEWSEVQGFNLDYVSRWGLPERCSVVTASTRAPKFAKLTRCSPVVAFTFISVDVPTLMTMRGPAGPCCSVDSGGSGDSDDAMAALRRSESDAWWWRAVNECGGVG